MDLAKYEKHILVAFVILGIILRIYGLDAAYMDRDEGIYSVAAVKMNHNNPYDPRLYEFTHPPVAKFFMGLGTRLIAEEKFAQTLQVPPQLFGYSYLVPYKDVIIPLRSMSVVFGLISLAFVYLISRELFGTRAAMWSAAMAAVSSQMIAFSRVVYQEVYVVAFILMTIYLYIKYLKTGNYLYIEVMIIALALALGSKSFFPWLLVPGILFTHLLHSRKAMKKFLPVLIATAVAFALFFYVIYPDGIRKAAIEGHYKTTDIISILNPSFELPDVVASFFFTNSYLFLFALLITLYGYRKRIMKAGFFKDNLKAPRYYTIFIVMFALSFLIYSFTAFGDTNKYLIYHNYVPLMILMGKPLSDFARNRKALLVLVIITAVSFAAIAPTFPYFGHYANFNVQKFYAYEIYGGSHITATQDAIDYLGSIGNPDIVTNEQNLIFKYQGKTSYILPPYDSSCNAEYAQSLTRKYIVYFAGYTVANSYQEDPYVCPYLRAYNLANVAEFKDDYQTFLNRFPVVVYKIEEAIPLEIQQG